MGNCIYAENDLAAYAAYKACATARAIIAKARETLLAANTAEEQGKIEEEKQLRSLTLTLLLEE